MLKSNKKRGHKVILHPGDIVMLALPAKKFEQPRQYAAVISVINPRCHICIEQPDQCQICAKSPMLDSRLRKLQSGQIITRSTNQIHKLELDKLINIEDSIDLFRMSSREHQRNCDVTDDNILYAPALNTRNRRPVVMNLQITNKQQKLLCTLLDKNLRTTSCTSGNTKVQNLQTKNTKIGSLKS